jgi:hypothetical protein
MAEEQGRNLCETGKERFGSSEMEMTSEITTNRSLGL